MPDMVRARHGRIRVLWLTKGLGPGGAERLLVSFAARADRAVFDLHAAYLLPHKNHLVQALGDLGVPSTCLYGERAGDPRWLQRLRRLVREDNIDVVHIHSPLVASQARLALRALPRVNRPFLIGTEHNLWSSHHPATRWANRVTLPLQDLTIAVSEQVRESMPPRLAQNTEVVVHGVDVDAIRARRRERLDARAELGITPDEVVVATVANLRANKDYPTMLRAARQLVDQGSPVTFLSIGQGPLASEIEEAHRRLELGDRFRLLGYRDDPIRVLVAADVFCLSSRYEGLPISMLEALAVGLPVVATRVGGVPSVVTDRREGLLVEPGDPAALANAIGQMVPSAARTAYATAALERSTDFHIDHAVERQQDLYESLAGRP